MSKAFLLLIFVFVMALFFSLWWWQDFKKPLKKTPFQEKEFVVPHGESIASVAQRLESDDLIKSALAFKLQAKLTRAVVQAGDFRLSPSMSPFDMLEILSQGRSDIWITVIPGWRREEIARALNEKLATFDQKRFLYLSQDREGQLFPDSYLIPKQSSEEEILDIIDKNFEKKFDQVNNSDKTSVLNSDQLLIIASLVEREVKHDKDRPIVAGIIIKRFLNDWPLQIDASIQYALGYQEQEDTWWKTNLTKDDLAIDSPYNNYKYTGLSPTPICSPSQVSIEAVLNYQESDYWYYLSDSANRMYYARTLKEHNENIRLHL